MKVLGFEFFGLGIYNNSFLLRRGCKMKVLDAIGLASLSKTWSLTALHNRGRRI